MRRRLESKLDNRNFDKNLNQKKKRHWLTEVQK